MNAKNCLLVRGIIHLITHLMSQEEKKENQTYWKARLGYNMRWVVEGVFSLFKRLFGGNVTALKWKNIEQEILLKVALYNTWRDESISGSRCIVDDVTD